MRCLTSGHSSTTCSIASASSFARAIPRYSSRSAVPELSARSKSKRKFSTRRVNDAPLIAGAAKAAVCCAVGAVIAGGITYAAEQKTKAIQVSQLYSANILTVIVLATN